MIIIVGNQNGMAGREYAYINLQNIKFSNKLSSKVKLFGLFLHVGYHFAIRRLVYLII